MPAINAFLKYLGKYGLRCGLNAVGAGVLGDFVIGGLEEVWEEWRFDRNEDQRRDEIQAVAQATTQEIRRQVIEIVQEIAAGKPPAVQERLTVYLSQVPAMVRRSLRRPSDPTGTTVRHQLTPKEAKDLIPFLPSRVSSFKPGDFPLKGVDWQLEELLGFGGFGEVWKAVNPEYPNIPPVALKFCLDRAAAGMLRNEAALLNRVMEQGIHEGIVQLKRTYMRAEIPFLEYEYVAGGDLSGLIKEGQDSGGGIGPDQACDVILRIAGIVAFAHRLNPPIVHRDLKPANILIQRGRDGKTQFKITDFGLGGIAARQAVLQANRKSSHGDILANSILGSYTPLYAPTQQTRGGKPDPRDDVYALGVIWYQLLTGELSKGSPTGQGWKKRLSARGMGVKYIDILERCFEEEPEERLPDAADLVEELTGSSLEPVPGPPKPDADTKSKISISGPKKEKPQVVSPQSIVIDLPNLPRGAKPLEMLLIPAGTFMMGSLDSEKDRDSGEGPQHKVTISQPFYLGKYPVTQAHWQAVMGSNPSYFKGDNLPVEQVSWNDCQTFIQKLNQLGQGTFRLPTEAEWEYACRAGTPTRLFWGDDPGYSQIGQYAWYRSNSNNQTHEVGLKVPNAWGLYDMSGNVWEWCQDWYGGYSSSPQIDPTGPVSGTYRVVRGGGWDYGAGSCRSAFRYYGNPGGGVSGGGFRLSRTK